MILGYRTMLMDDKNHTKKSRLKNMIHNVIIAGSETVLKG